VLDRDEPRARGGGRQKRHPDRQETHVTQGEEVYARRPWLRFEGKRGLVLGVANRRSIAWAIAKRLADGGAQLAFTYQGERIEKSVRELADSVSSPHVTACDVRSDEDVKRVFDEVGTAFGGQLDLLVHSVAFRGGGGSRGSVSRTRRATAFGSHWT
jgi:enoyl-[acyl-carrier protein] reductase I